MSGNHRRYNGPRGIRPPKGFCRWCYLEIKKPDGARNLNRAFCSAVCTTYFMLRFDPQLMRQHVFFRDNGVCAACGFQHVHMKGPWQCDHRIPLYVGAGDPALFEPDNCQILCNQCHHIKTAADRKRYKAKSKRVVKRIAWLAGIEIQSSD